jgi:hypothetical protein
MLQIYIRSAKVLYIDLFKPILNSISYIVLFRLNNKVVISDFHLIRRIMSLS